MVKDCAPGPANLWQQAFVRLLSAIANGKSMTSNMTANKLDKILAIVCSVFDAYSAVLFLPVEDRAEDLRLVSSFSLGNKILNNASVQPGSLVAWIQARDNPLIVPNFDRHPTRLGYYEDGEEDTIRAFMGCPIPTGGVLCVDSKRQYSFSEKDSKILHLFAQLIASQQDGLVRQDLTGEIPSYFVTLGMIQDLRFRHRRWPDFIRNFLATVAKASQFGYAAFASVERDDTYCLESESRPLLLQEDPRLYLPMGNGSIVGMLFRNGSDQIFETEGGEGDIIVPIFGREPEFPEFRAAICMPIMVNKNTKAVLCLADEGERRIDESLRSFVRLASDHLALFLENLYLKNRVRKMLPAPGDQAYPGREQDNIITGNFQS